jgi:protein O-mannosyl-transferase
MFQFTRLFDIDKLKISRLPPHLRDRASLTLSLSFVLLLVFLVYLPSLRNAYVNWDDEGHLLKNPFLMQLDLAHIRDIFSTTVNKIYLPLTLLSFAIERHFFGTWPVIYHLDNLILHMLATGLVFLFSLRMGMSRFAASVAALLFGIHPMHVESVAWVTQRKDVLYSFFYLLAICCYCDYIRGLQDFGPQKKEGKAGFKVQRNAPLESGLRPLLATFVFGFLAILAKPMALSLPFVLFLLDWFYRRQITLRLISEKFLLGMLFLPVVWMTYHAHARAVNFRWPESVLLEIWSFSFYIRKFMFPDYFVLIYHVPEPKAITQPVYLIAAMVFLGFWLAVILRRRDRLFVFATFFFIASVFFLLRWDQQADINIVADRFMYLPSVGFCLVLGWYFEKIFKHNSKKGLRNLCGVLLLFTLIVIFIGKTNFQISVWKNGTTLWKHQLLTEPSAARALTYNKIAEAMMGQMMFREAQNRYQNIDSRDTKTINITIKTINEAIRFIDRALEIKPDYAHAYYQKGLLLFKLGDFVAALENLENAVRYDPENFDAFYYIGLLLQREGKHKEAIQSFCNALKIIPDNTDLREKVVIALKRGLMGNSAQLYKNELVKMMAIY